ncbi:TrbM/KikA/MpfK family conjugal transfer protein [Metapseudomonas otitidis]|uniref:TrbM/KikA/MpfK family conjugal transfer protein n=1 Tax=Metapseudomonas otitidis TaxID=319939 RepID=UPI000D1B945A|nr:TrbM/KikA/MpfK family conjugal transfer protein [Pseudomonas otitidis]
MKRLIAPALAVFLAVGVTPAYAKDPCKTVLCMFGKLSGKGVVENCDDAVQDYFDIVKKKKKKIRWDQTSDARKQFLDSCPGADRNSNNAINNKFGKVAG